MSIYQKASLVQIPSGYKAADDKLYSVVPSNGDGDFTVTVDADATRVNKDGLIESVAADQARLNYDPTNPQDPHLLLEPSRTNVQIRSEEFENSAWSKTRITVSDNNVTSPSGGLNASKLAENTSGTNAYFIDDLYSQSSGTYTFSCFLKKGTLRYAGIRALTNNFNNRHFVLVDLDNGNVTSTNTSGSGVSWEYNVDSYSNGWYRLSITGSHTSSNVGLLISGSNEPTPSYGGVIPSYNADGNGNFYAWGAQVEAGSYPTSYIPTSGSAVTRTADTAKIDDFSNAPTDYPFTIFCDFDLVKTGQKSFMFSFLWLASTSTYFAVGYNVDGGGNFFKFENRAQGSAEGVKTTSTYTEDRYKLAIKFVSSTNFKAFIDGVEVADYTHTAISFNSAISDFLLGQLRVSGDTGDRTPIHQFMVFNEALPDTELEEITSYKSFGQMAKALLYTIE